MEKEITLTRELVEAIIFNLSKNDRYFSDKVDKKLTQFNIALPENDEGFKTILDTVPNGIIESILFLI